MCGEEQLSQKAQKENNGSEVRPHLGHHGQKTQRGLWALHEDRSSNQRLRKLGPLEVVSKLKRRNLFWLFVPSGIWALPGSLPHVPSRRALAQNKH